MLSNAYFLAKFRFDTAENEPAKNLQILEKNLQNLPILLSLTFVNKHRWTPPYQRVATPPALPPGKEDRARATAREDPTMPFPERYL